MKYFKNENLVITKETDQLLSKVEIDEVEELYKKVSKIRNHIEDLSNELEGFDISLL